jgi:hypothetical protein
MQGLVLLGAGFESLPAGSTCFATNEAKNRLKSNYVAGTMAARSNPCVHSVSRR